MKVIERGVDGSPREVDLTIGEQVVSAIHSNLMDRGMDQGTALAFIAGWINGGPDPEPSVLDAILCDEFLWYLSS